jgi:hypothetical protein
VLAAVEQALDALADAEGAGATVQEMRQTLEKAATPQAAVKAVKVEVAAGAAGWAMADGCGYRPFEALALLEEMAAWLRWVFVGGLLGGRCVCVGVLGRGAGGAGAGGTDRSINPLLVLFPQSSSYPKSRNHSSTTQQGRAPALRPPRQHPGARGQGGAAAGGACGRVCQGERV